MHSKKNNNNQIQNMMLLNLLQRKYLNGWYKSILNRIIGIYFGLIMQFNLNNWEKCNVIFLLLWFKISSLENKSFSWNVLFGS